MIRVIGKLLLYFITQAFPVKIYVLPGGNVPKRQTKGAAGFDVHIRAVVSAYDMDEKNPLLRKTLFDFQHKPEEEEFERPEEKSIPHHIVEIAGEKKPILAYRLEPGQRVLVGIGFTTEMQFPAFFWLTPRSGLASKYGISLMNTPGTVDADYRGEAGAVICNLGDRPLDLYHDMRIAQMLFAFAIIPTFRMVDSHEALKGSDRGAGGFGSTGT